MRSLATVILAFPMLVSFSRSERNEKPASRAKSKCNWWIDAMAWLEIIRVLFLANQFSGIPAVAGQQLSATSR